MAVSKAPLRRKAKKSKKHAAAQEQLPHGVHAPLKLNIQRESLRQPETVLQLQQVIGNRAVQRLLAADAANPTQKIQQRAASGLVQRNVGFEFEVGDYAVQNLKKPMGLLQQIGIGKIKNSQIDNSPLKKGDVLATGRGFELQIDEGVDNMHLEFVTAGKGFPETDKGREDLSAATTAMEIMAHKIAARGKQKSGVPIRDIGNGIPVIAPSEVGSDGRHANAIILSGGKEMEASPQATVGLRLDQIANLMEKLGKGADPNESQQTKLKRAPGRSMMMGASEADSLIVGKAPGNVRQALQTFKNQRKQYGQPVPDYVGSDSLIGLLALLSTYLIIGKNTLKQYAKTIAPMLARTNFASMFSLLPHDEQEWFRDMPLRFSQIALMSSGMENEGDKPVFAGGFKELDYRVSQNEAVEIVNALKQLSRSEWLKGIPKGEDKLTAKKFIVQKYASELESMGSFNHMDNVGKEDKERKTDTRTSAPIIEMRRMMKSIGMYEWSGFALDVFDFVRAYNNLEDPNYSDTNREEGFQKWKSELNFK